MVARVRQLNRGGRGDSLTSIAARAGAIYDPTALHRCALTAMDRTMLAEHGAQLIARIGAADKPVTLDGMLIMASVRALPAPRISVSRESSAYVNMARIGNRV